MCDIVSGGPHATIADRPVIVAATFFVLLMYVTFAGRQPSQLHDDDVIDAEMLPAPGDTTPPEELPEQPAPG